MTWSEEAKKRESLSRMGSGNPMWGKHKNNSGKKNPMYGRHHRTETIELYRKTRKGMFSGINHPHFGKTVYHSKKFKYRGMWFDSSYELKFFKHYKKLGVPLKRNYTRLLLVDEKGPFTFVPDFVMPDPFKGGPKFIEIKGWYGPRTVRILEALVKLKEKTGIGYKVTFVDGPILKKMGIKL
jgi:hypothetical protein